MSTIENPKWIAPNFSSIPEKLKALPWAVWKGSPRNGKPGKFDKPPCSPSTGRKIGTNQPELFSSYEDAKRAYEAGGWDGVGILLTAGSGVVGVDIDDAEETIRANPKVQEICRAYRRSGGYIEQSPSGNGFHGYAFGNLPPGRRKVGPLEIYDSARFLTITGHGKGAVQPDQGFIDQFHALIESSAKPAKKKTPSSTGSDQAADDSIVRGLTALMILLESDLWLGNWAAKGYPSQSEADQALANKIAFQARIAKVAPEAAFETVAAVFSRSQLGARDKWTTRADYRTGTVGNALASAGYGAEDSGNSDGASQAASSAITAFGARYFVAPIGGKTLVFDRQADDIIGAAMSPPSFHHLHANKFADGGKLSQKWFNSKVRETFDRVTFDPSGRNLPTEFNVWRGLPMAPRPGRCHRVLRHLKYVWCSGSRVQFRYVLYWMAQLVQKPWLKPEVALVLRSVEGTGKTILTNILLAIVGRHGFTAAQTSQVAGNFNGHLHDKLLVVMEEAMFAGDPKADSAAKVLITNPHMSYEWKGKDAILGRSYHHVMILSNRAWAVPAGPDARRYAVLDVSAHRKGDFAYFKALMDEIETGGSEAFLHFLLKLDIAKFDPRRLPSTRSLQQQQVETLLHSDPVRGWWLTVLAEGAFPVEGGEIPWGLTISATELQDSYKYFTGGARHAPPWPAAIKQIKKLLPAGALGKSRPRSGNLVSTRHYEYTLPALADARAEFASVTGMDPTS